MRLTDAMQHASKALMYSRHYGCLVNPDGTPVEVRPLLRQLRNDLAQLDPEELCKLPQGGERMLTVLRIGAEELERLSGTGVTGAVRSLGYALHVLPDLLQGSEEFSRRRFLFNFRIAAFHWRALSPEMQQALCELMRIAPDLVARVICHEGFGIDMFPERPAGT